MQDRIDKGWRTSYLFLELSPQATGQGSVYSAPRARCQNPHRQRLRLRPSQPKLENFAGLISSTY